MTHLQHERLPHSCRQRSPVTDVVVIHPGGAVGGNGPAARVYVDGGEIQVCYPQITDEIFSCRARAV